MEFFDKYKNIIIAAVVGALVAIVLSYLIDIPFWVTGAIIGASSSWLTEKATVLTDQQLEKYQAKKSEKKAD